MGEVVSGQEFGGVVCSRFRNFLEVWFTIVLGIKLA
jgi:hypothetical protein